MEEAPKQKLRRGFAAMSLEKRRAIAASGGRSAHAQGKAHQWDRQTAIAAGEKGGKASRDAKARVRLRREADEASAASERGDVVWAGVE